MFLNVGMEEGTGVAEVPGGSHEKLLEVRTVVWAARAMGSTDLRGKGASKPRQ